MTRETREPMMSPVNRVTLIYTLLALAASVMIGRAWAGPRADAVAPPPMADGCCGPSGCCCCDSSGGAPCGDDGELSAEAACKVQLTCGLCECDGGPHEDPAPVPCPAPRVKCPLAPIRAADSIWWAEQFFNRAVTGGRIDPLAARLAERPPEPLLEVLCTRLV